MYVTQSSKQWGDGMEERATGTSAATRINKNLPGSLLKWSFISSLIWMLLGHGYFFFSDAFSFDSLQTVAQDDTSWKLSLGRFAQPIYKGLIRGNISSPWLIGICSIFFLALTVYLLAKLFKLNNWQSVFAVSGVLGVNLTMIITVASYVHETDVFMLALLLMTAAVYLWHHTARTKLQIFYLMLGALCISFSLGLYQAYISVGVTLVILALIYDCFDDSVKSKQTIARILKAVAMFALGCILYYIFLQISLAVSGKAISTDTNGLSNLFDFSGTSLFSMIVQSYQDVFSFFFIHTSSYSPLFVVIGNWILLAVILGGTVLLTYRRREKMVRALILIFLLPLAMSLIRLFNPGEFYELMMHAYFLYYVLAVVIIEAVVRRVRKTNGIKWTQMATVGLVFCITFCSVRFANQAYLKKDLESKAFQSYMTEVFTMMDSVDGYEPGVTQVLFLTQPSMQSIGYAFDDGKFDEFNGLSNSSFYATKWRFQWYLQFIMQRPVSLFEDTEAIERFKAIDTVQNMPTFPTNGCMKIVEYVLVVKLSDNAW